MLFGEQGRVLGVRLWSIIPRYFEERILREVCPGNLGKVYLGDNQPCGIIGKGVVKIKLNRSVWELKDVRHIPDLRKNLISVGQLASEGYTKIFHGENWKI